MLRDRLGIVLLLLPPMIWIFAQGGWLYGVAVTLVLLLAGAEFGLLFRRLGLRPSVPLILAGVGVLSLSRLVEGLGVGPALTGLCLVSMVWHLVDFERGAPRSGTDFAVTVAGFVYVGWIGSYLIALRGLPDGEWWLLLALPSVWLGDSAAYFVGKAIGRHRLSPRLSPKKTWEGYLAGIGVGAASGAGLALIWHVGAGPDSAVSAWTGVLLGTVVATLAPLGDLGISMFKREVGVKDSGTLLPGHGGVLDRLDSWIWAAALGFYVVSGLSG
jgi:phosphatidate cytidylyltransferase